MLLFVLNRSSSALDLGLPTSPRHTVPTLPQHRTRALTGESASAEGTRGVVGRQAYAGSCATRAGLLLLLGSGVPQSPGDDHHTRG